MNYLDIIIILPIIYLGWKGLKKGIIIEIFTLLALLVGIYAAVHFADQTSTWLKKNVQDVPYLPVVSFVLTFLGAGALVFFGGKALEKVVSIASLGFMNKTAGAIFGAIKGALIVSVLLVALESIDDKKEFIPNKLRKESLLYEPILSISKKIYPSIDDSNLFSKNFDKFNDILPNIEDIELPTQND